MPNPDKNQLIHDLTFQPKKRLDMFLSLQLGERTATLRLLSKTVARNLLNRLPQSELLLLLEEVDPDEATDWLQLIPTPKRQQVMQQLSHDLQQTIATLLEFDPQTAAGLMTLDYIQVETDADIATVAARLKRHEQRTGRLPIVLVANNGRLAGFLPGDRLILGQPIDPVTNFMRRLPSIHYAASHDKVIELFRSHPHGKVVVLNDDHSILGVIYSDDVLKLMGDQESASLSEFAGISEEENVTDTAAAKVKFRYKWLIINLATAFLAAFTVSLFEATIASYVLLAIYMPIVAGMGGNAATQTLAVVVRGIALRQIDLKGASKTLKSELGAGFLNGLINGLIVAMVVLVFNQDIKLAIVLGVAMVANLLVAGFFGTMIPLLMARLGKDPAASATVFITTATDVLGFLTFLGLAALVLG